MKERGTFGEKISRKKDISKQHILNEHNDLWLHLTHCLASFNGVINGQYASRKRHL